VTTLPPLPSQGSTGWYPWAQALHNATGSAVQAADLGTGNSNDVALKAAFGLRRRELPGTAGLLTAYGSGGPTVALGAANGPPSVFTGVAPNGPLVTTVGAVLAETSALDPASYGSVSISPISGNSFQVWRAGMTTDAPVINFQVRGNTAQYRVWVDGHPLTLTPSTLPGGGAFYMISVTFSGRAIRRVDLEIDSGLLAGIFVDATDTVFAPVSHKGIRAVIIGDSYTEGTGADSRLTAWGQTFGQLCGWAETVVSGSGGTGYVYPGPGTGNYVGRVKYRDRFANDVAAFSPDVIVFTGGRNDVGNATPTAVQAEATTLFALAQSTVPGVRCFVTSTFPASATEAADTSLTAVSNAIKAAAQAAGFPFLDLMGSNAYITGTGHVGAPTGSGNADHLTSSDGVHPSQLGHDMLARAVFSRFVAALPA
jgi:lysophospholipase L1-like esterase